MTNFKPTHTYPQRTSKQLVGLCVRLLYLHVCECGCAQVHVHFERFRLVVVNEQKPNIYYYKSVTFGVLNSTGRYKENT